MVRVKAPLMSMSAQKQLGHSLIYKQKGSRSIVTAYNKPGGKNPSPASPTQLNKRMIYNLIIARWQTFTGEEKAVYNDLVKAKNLNMSGWNYFYQQSLTDLPTYLGLIGYWSFNEIVGGKVLDLSGNGNHTDLLPTYPTDSPTLIDSIGPKFGKAGDFDGGNYLRTGHDLSLNLTSEISGFAMVKKSSDGEIFAKGYNSGYRLNINDGKLRVLIKGGTNILDSNYVLDDDTWYFVGFVSNSVGTYIYINGELKNSNANAYAIDDTSSADIFIGQSGGLTVSYLTGSVDDVKIYKRTLSPTEILNQYKLITKK